MQPEAENAATGPRQEASPSAQPAAGRTPVFVEVFCGVARLSKAARNLGFKAVPIDHVCKADGIKVLQVDVSSKAGRAQLKGLLENPDVRWVHWAPPCGTFSRAREIKRRDGPKPLRNLSHIRGFPRIKRMTDRVRVKAANELVTQMVSWCRALSARGVCWTIENPSNSLIWAFPGLSDLVAEAHVVHLHACMFGSQRKKATALVSNRSWFRKTNIQCSGDHPHASWGKTRSSGKKVWATSLESAYTSELSHAWASCAAASLERELRDAPPSKKRMRKEACEPDFDNVVTVHADEAAPFASMFPPCKVPRRFARWPKGSRLLFFDETDFSATLAVPSPPEVWCRRAMSLQHPRRLLQPLSPDMERALEAEISHDGCRVGKVRTEACKDINGACKAAAAEELELRKNLHPDVSAVTRTKQSVAMKRLLVQIGHVDPTVADAIREGFPLVGWLPASGFWDSDCEPPSLSTEALLDMSLAVSEKSMKTICKHRSPDMEPSVWAVTKEEAAKGWLTFRQNNSLSRGSVVSSRFGVRQKNKIRPIDNFRSSMVNSACGVREKVTMDGVDEIVSVCLHWLRRRKPVHPDVRVVGRTWDLKSAYKQLAAREDHKRFAAICTIDPDTNSVRIADVHSMPFGALAAVHAFLRCGEALKAVGRSKLLLVMTNFFDDFTVLSCKSNSKHVGLVVSFMFKKMGWDVAQDEKKNAPFAEVFDVLGVRIDLSQQHLGLVSVWNTPDRLDELRADVQRLLESKRITYEEAQRLRGRFLFAEQNVWGRNSRQAIVRVGDVPDTAVGPVDLTEVQLDALAFLQKRVLDGKPRCFSCRPRVEARLWLDGACEWDVPSSSPICGFGGVLFVGDQILAWGSELPKPDAKRWSQRVGKQQLVFECELLPYLTSLQLWSTLLHGCDLLIFIDNDAARASLAKSFTRKEEGARIVFAAVEEEERLDVQAFFMRVPTASNIADGPSRGDFSLIFKIGGRRVDLPPNAIQAALGL